VDTVQRLDEIKLFDALSSDDLVRWADRFQRQHYHRGTEVLRQGASPTAFFVVDQGELRARERVGDQDLPRAYYFAGDYFGELGLLTGQPHRVTIDVLTDAELLVLEKLVLLDASARTQAVPGSTGKSQMRSRYFSRPNIG
jgi:CRP-like cAMP-binding protein